MNLEEIFATPSEGSKPKSGKVVAADGHTYYKSSSANATEAPTNKGTHDKLAADIAAVGANLSQFELDFVMMCQAYYDIYHVLIPEEVAIKRYGITDEIYKNTLALPNVQAALLANKILAPETEGEPLLDRNEVLTPLELAVANTMLDLIDQRSYKKKLQDLNLSTRDYDRMLRKPAFQKYCQEKASTALRAGQHEADLALLDQVQAGNLKAIAYFHEYTGAFTPSTSKGTTVNVGTQSSGDVHYIITRLIEIITEEVTDKDTAARIADRVKMLIGASRVANQIVESEVIEVPQVAAMRTQTDVTKAIEARAGIKDG